MCATIQERFWLVNRGDDGQERLARVYNGDMKLATIPQVLDERPWATERWLRRLRAERRVPTYSAAGRVLFDVDALDDYVEATRREAV